MVGELLGINSFRYNDLNKKMGGVGWHRIFMINDNSGIVNVSKEWYSGRPCEVLIYFQSFPESLRQIAGNAISDFITKMRITKNSSGNRWVEVYYNMENENPILLSFSNLLRKFNNEVIDFSVAEEDTTILNEITLINM